MLSTSAIAGIVGVEVASLVTRSVLQTVRGAADRALYVLDVFDNEFSARIRNQ